MAKTPTPEPASGKTKTTTKAPNKSEGKPASPPPLFAVVVAQSDNGENAYDPKKKGKLLSLRQARQTMGGISEAGFRNLMLTEFRPPGFKRPGSNRWLFWEGELLAWLESARVMQQRVESGHA